MTVNLPFKIDIRGIDNVSGVFKSVRSQAQVLSKSLTKVGSTLTTALTLPTIAIAGFGLKQAANLEQLEIAFTGLAGGADNAKAIMKDLIDFTAKTPFQLDGVAQSARSLLSFGIAQKDIIPSLKTLGDIAAGTGSRVEDLAIPFGRIRAQGKVTLEELNKFTDRGVPILDALSKKFGISILDVRKQISKGTIGFKEFSEALEDVRNEKFLGQLEKQSKSLGGAFSTLKDNFVLLAAEFGLLLSKDFKLVDLMNSLTGGIQSLTKWVRELSPGTRKLIAFGTIAAVVIGPLLLGLGAIAGAVAFLTPVLAGIGAVGLPVLAGIGLAAAAIIRYWKPLQPFFKGLWAVIAFTFKTAFAIISPILKMLLGMLDGIFDKNRTGRINVEKSVQGTSSAQLVRALKDKESKIKVDFSNVPKGTNITEVASGNQSSVLTKVGYALPEVGS